MSSPSLSGARQQAGSVVLLEPTTANLTILVSSEEITRALTLCVLCQASLSGNLEISRFGQQLHPGWDPASDGATAGLLVAAPYAGLGHHNHGKLYYFPGQSCGSVGTEVLSVVTLPPLSRRPPAPRRWWRHHRSVQLPGPALHRGVGRHRAHNIRDQGSSYIYISNYLNI